jgi:hypothetical protein
MPIRRPPRGQITHAHLTNTTPYQLSTGLDPPSPKAVHFQSALQGANSAGLDGWVSEGRSTRAVARAHTDLTEITIDLASAVERDDKRRASSHGQGAIADTPHNCVSYIESAPHPVARMHVLWARPRVRDRAIRAHRESRTILGRPEKHESPADPGEREHHRPRSAASRRRSRRSAKRAPHLGRGLDDQ